MTQRLSDKLTLRAVLDGAPLVIGLAILVGLAILLLTSISSPPALATESGTIPTCYTDQSSGALTCTGFITQEELDALLEDAGDDGAQGEGKLNCPHGYYWDFATQTLRCNPEPTPTPKPACPTGMERNSANECVCKSGLVKNQSGTACITPPTIPPTSKPDCPTGMERNSDNECVCKSDYTPNPNGEGCLPPCPGDKVRINEQCRCPSGTTEQSNDRCVRTTTTTTTPTETPTLDPPSHLVLSFDENDPDIPKIAYGYRPRQTNHFHFRLFRRDAEPSADALASESWDGDGRVGDKVVMASIAGPQSFESQERGGWYFVVARTCTTTAGTNCGDVAHSNVVASDRIFVAVDGDDVVEEPAEGAVAPDLTFTVNAPKGVPDSGLGLTFSTSGTTTVDDDYDGPASSLNLAAGTTDATLKFTINHDFDAEVRETLEVRLKAITSGSARIDTHPAVVHITDPIELPDNATHTVDLIAHGAESCPPAIVGGPSPTGTSCDTIYLDIATRTSSAIGDFTNRVYMVQVEKTEKGEDTENGANLRPKSVSILNAAEEWVSADDDVEGLPAHKELAPLSQKGRYFAWREAGNPPAERRLRLVVEYDSSKPFYRLAVSKPDFAVVERPTVTFVGGKPRMSVVVYNATDNTSAVREDKTFLEVVCDSGFDSTPERFSFESLHDRNSKVILANSQATLADEVLCVGLENIERGTPGIVAKVGVRAGVVTDFAGEGEWTQTKVAPGSKTSGKISVDDTLWALTKPIVGGLQLTEPGSCTVSFPLVLSKSGEDPQAAVSTTAHCVTKYPLTTHWEQGPRGGDRNELRGGTAFASDLGLPDSKRGCRIAGSSNPDEWHENCKLGDQAYTIPIWGSDVDVTKEIKPTEIFRPAEQNTSGRADLEANHFRSAAGGKTFKLIGARPPAEGDVMHKVGRTTGWTTSGPLKLTGQIDSTCPSGVYGEDDNITHKFTFECLAYPELTVDEGDSGAPVFVFKNPGDTGSEIEVYLVGVVFSRKNDLAGVIPIDRIYRESLLHGYDWAPTVLSQLPSADEGNSELVIDAAADQVIVRFDHDQFIGGSGTTYEAKLFTRTDEGIAATPIASLPVSARSPAATFTHSAMAAEPDPEAYSVRVDTTIAPSITVAGTPSTRPARIKAPPPPPAAITISGLEQNLSPGQSGQVTITASNLYDFSDYSIRVSVRGHSFGLDDTCGLLSNTVRVPKGSTSHTVTMDVRRCSIHGATIFASLLLGRSEVDLARIDPPVAPLACSNELGRLGESVDLNSYWTNDDCSSEHRTDRRARYYTFSLDAPRALRIDLSSISDDTYLYLLSGPGRTGKVLYENDDIDEQTDRDSAIEVELPAGTYTIEATTYAENSTGRFRLQIRDSDMAPSPTGLAAGDLSAGSVTLSWNAVTDASAYQVEMRQGGGGTWTVAATSITGTTQAVSGLTVCDQAYWFRVSARGDGDPYATDYGFRSTGTVTVTTPACADPAVAISELGTVPDGGSDPFKVTLTGLDPANAHSLVLNVEQGLGFAATCPERTSTHTIPAGSSTKTLNLTLYRCGATDGVVDAALSTGTTLIAQTSHSPSGGGACNVRALGALGSEMLTNTGRWAGNCASEHRNGRNARYRSFALDAPAIITITVTGSVNPHLFLLEGSTPTSPVLTEARNNGLQARITAVLEKGTYIVEIVARAPDSTGTFNLGITRTGSCGRDLGAINGPVTVSDFQVFRDCPDRASGLGSASTFTFTLTEARELRMQLSTVNPNNPRIPELHLIHGQNLNARAAASAKASAAGQSAIITRTLQPGSYVIQAGADEGQPHLNLQISIVPSGGATGAI